MRNTPALKQHDAQITCFRTRLIRPTQFGAIACLTAAVIWGSSFAVSKVAMQAVDAWHLTVIRYGIVINFVPITAFLIGVVQGYRFNWAELLGSIFVVSALLVSRIAARPAAS